VPVVHHLETSADDGLAIESSIQASVATQGADDMVIHSGKKKSHKETVQGVEKLEIESKEIVNSEKRNVGENEG
jgi:hypothetical protein